MDDWQDDAAERAEERRVSRRHLVEGASTTVAGLLVGAYIKPAMRSLGAPSELTAVSGFDSDGGKGKGKGKGK
jgi:hypothetical protein